MQTTKYGWLKLNLKITDKILTYFDYYYTINIFNNIIESFFINYPMLFIICIAHAVSFD